MGSQEGWIAIRKFPLPESTNLRNNKYYEKILESFFKKHRICPRCKGEGFTIENEDIERKDVQVVKYDRIKALRILKKKTDIIFGDLMREIFLHEFAGRRTCARCKGFRFVKRVKK